jgi:hypothetical protein
MTMRWKAAIAIACGLLLCVALLLRWEYRSRPAQQVKVLRARAAQGGPKAQFSLGSACYYGREFRKTMPKRSAGTEWQPAKVSLGRRMLSDSCT